MELIVTGVALQVRKLVRLDMQNRITNRAGLDALEFLVHIFLPQQQSILQSSALIVEHLGNLEGPTLPAMCRNSQRLGAIDLGPSKWKGEWQLDQNAQSEVVLDVRGTHLPGDRSTLDVHVPKGGCVLNTLNGVFENVRRYLLLDEFSDGCREILGARGVPPVFGKSGKDLYRSEYDTGGKLRQRHGRFDNVFHGNDNIKLDLSFGTNISVYQGKIQNGIDGLTNGNVGSERDTIC
mmetsp:Transcript_12044/g.24849  ORF Transcript_12044/g.24849 Transcript_12044/m.24849 type:complete len:236 (-) Transcript_12044:1437-2144(-)